MKTEFQYLRFVETEKKPKTSVWSCLNKHYNVELGVIKWYFNWRQYVYIPTAEAVYSAGCLSDIAEFIKQLAEERKS